MAAITKATVITLPSSCPPSIEALAFSASSEVSNSTYAKPLDNPTALSICSSAVLILPKVAKISEM